MKPKIGVIVSTTRPTRVGRGIAEWFLDQTKNYSELDFELIDLTEVDLPFLSEEHSPSTGKYSQKKVIEWSKKVWGLDGFVVIMAEYNNGVPAPLKNAFDTLYHEWAKKPFAFVGYGTYAAARAIDHFAANIAKVNAMPLTSTVVGIVEPWAALDEEGWPKPEFVKGNLEGMLSNLTEWTIILKASRTNKN